MTLHCRLRPLSSTDLPDQGSQDPWVLQGHEILSVAAASLSASVSFFEDENHAVWLFRQAVRILNNMESVVL